ncbi:radical SAM protein [Hydrogenophaga soli]
MQYNPITNTFDRSEAPNDGTLPHVMWHITDMCPLNCGYCFSPKTDKRIELSNIPVVVSRLRSLGAQKIDIAGGEPGIFSGLTSVIEAIREADMHCTVTTSGVSRRENSSYLAANIRKLSRLIVSIDALEASHDKLRNFVGAWNAATKLIASIDPDLRRNRVRVNSVITKPLLASDGLYQLAEAISKFGIHEWCLIEPHPANAKPKFVEYEISNGDFIDACARIQDAFPQIKFLTRQRELYSSYWVLHPDGMLRQHSETADDGLEIDLLGSPIVDIKAQVSVTKTKLPNQGDQK